MGDFEQLIYGPGSAARLYLAGIEPGRPGVAVLHPWWGLNADVLAYADRLAGAGFAVAAPDMFAGKEATTIESAEVLAEGADRAACAAITLASIDRLREVLGSAAPIATLGFSFGAAWAIWAPAKRPDVKAAVVYYGTMTGPSLAGSTAPVLGHFAESDPYETDESVAAFERDLRDAGRSSTIHRYPGAGHWFAEPSRADAYDRDASELAWDRTTAFLGERLAVR